MLTINFGCVEVVRKEGTGFNRVANSDYRWNMVTTKRVLKGFPKAARSEIRRNES